MAIRAWNSATGVRDLIPDIGKRPKHFYVRQVNTSFQFYLHSTVYALYVICVNCDQRVDDDLAHTLLIYFVLEATWTRTKNKALGTKNGNIKSVSSWTKPFPELRRIGLAELLKLKCTITGGGGEELEATTEKKVLKKKKVLRKELDSCPRPQTTRLEFQVYRCRDAAHLVRRGVRTGLRPIVSLVPMSTHSAI